MSNCDETMHMSPDERFHEVATILATAVLRLRQRAALPSKETLEISEEIPPEGLDLSGETRLSVLVG